MAAKLPHIKRPCSNCPMKKNSLRGWLGRSRMAEILAADSFTCHKTDAPRLQCAGHMLLLGNKNVFVRLAKIQRLKLNLSGRELLFDTVDECIDHHDTTNT